jgi:hypothetical protein
MPLVLGPAIPIASPTATRCDFGAHVDGVNVQIRFFADAAGLVPIAPGTGSATLTASSDAFAYRSPRAAGERVPVAGGRVTSQWDSPTLVGAVDGRWYLRGLGGGADTLTITPSAIVPPGGAVTYAIGFDCDGVVS